MSRILLLLTAPAWRGSGVSFAKIARGLAASGHQVTAVVAASEVAEGLLAAGVADVRQLQLSGSGLASIWRLAALQRRERWALALVDAPRDLRLAGSVGIPAVVWRFNLPNRPVPDDRISRWRFRRVRHVVVQSAFAATLARQATPRLTRRGMTTIANGYDLDRLRPDAARGLAWRARHGVPPDAPLLVTVGALSPEKALPEVLGLGDRLVASLPALCQVFVGDGELAGRLGRAAPPHRRFLGQCTSDDTHDALRAADLVVQWSPREMFPNVVAEAMALGGVVVVPDSGAAPEIAGDAGVVLPAGPLGEHAERLVALLQRTGERSRLGEAARARVAACFPLARMVDQYDHLCRQVLGVADGPRAGGR